ncbi:hypothetical protein DQ04_17321010 [Trypanosoma grayi]|uniref:hypothetical protein n=1 Tax=Trypanosoma grayi TaxID=71804 RepID=UPI0004F4B97E|nr:hypothetical protein DQ04_17321010 [Trypanosoma grayi]KEG05920.1 hypothetical protein DQ04_17321010 [Trypanosoma grayi]
MEKRTVSPPAGYDVKAVGEVVVKCIPPPAAETPAASTKPPTPLRLNVGLDRDEHHEKASAGQTPPLDSITISEDNGNTNTEVTEPSQKPEATADLPAPTSSEAESKETENSVTVNDADHTAPTATPQAGTTAEEALNTDAGTPTSAGEDAAANASPAPNGIPPSDVNPPDPSTDASSSTAWVRAPLLLLLAGVAVW